MDFFCAVYLERCECFERGMNSDREGVFCKNVAGAGFWIFVAKALSSQA